MKSVSVIIRDGFFQPSRSLHVRTMESRLCTKNLSVVITENRLTHHYPSRFREDVVFRRSQVFPKAHLFPSCDPKEYSTHRKLVNNLRNHIRCSRSFATAIQKEHYLNFSTSACVTTKESDPTCPQLEMNQLHQAKNIWRKANAVCFDVDSTVIQDEAIDELAKFCGKGDEVEQLTQEAMKGGMDFRQALALRLDLIRPSLTQLRNYIFSSKQRLSPYVKELIHELHKREKEVYLISGGFRSIIIPLAQELHIPSANVHANKLKFYYDGEYAGFDENQLTSRTGGKGAVIRNLKEKHGYESVVMIGDGITDWEASPPADLFIGFGGNAYRHEVKSRAKWYVTDFRDLINELRD